MNTADNVSNEKHYNFDDSKFLFSFKDELEQVNIISYAEDIRLYHQLENFAYDVVKIIYSHPNITHEVLAQELSAIYDSPIEALKEELEKVLLQLQENNILT